MLDPLNLARKVTHKGLFGGKFTNLVLQVHHIVYFLFGAYFALLKSFVVLVAKAGRFQDRVKHFQVFGIDRLLSEQSLREQIFNLDLVQQRLDYVLLQLL